MALTSSTFSSKNLHNFKSHLEELRKRYFKEFLFSDPLQFPGRYKSPLDREVSAVISAIFAYGRVSNIINFLEKVHQFLGESPYEGLFKEKKWNCGGYRFQTEGDVQRFFICLKKVYSKYQTLEELFTSFDGNPEERLLNFVICFRERAKPLTSGVDHLLSLPSKKSPAKRWRLFLRWVVREDDGLDLGLWRSLKPSELIIPLDTHIAQNARKLNLTKRKTKDLKFAIEVTESLKLICKDDPLKYDFALVREDILRNLLKKEE